MPPSTTPLPHPTDEEGHGSMPWKIAAFYVVVAGVWILVSDRILDALPLGPAAYRWANSSKGLFFVLTTGGLLYMLMRRWARRVDQGHAERMKAESAFRSVVESAPDAIFVEVGGAYVFANARSRELLGIADSGSLSGVAVADHFDAAARARMADCLVPRSPEAPPAGTVETTIRRADGKSIPVELKAVPIEHAGRRAALVFARDLTPRLEAEAARRRQQELLQAVIRSTADAVFVKDTACRYLLINDSGARFLGQSIDRILGRRDDDFLSKPLAAALEASDRQVLQSGRRCEFQLPMMVNGQRRQYFVSKEPLLDLSGRTNGLIEVARDRTDHMAAEDSLRRLSGLFLRLQDEERRGIARELHDTTAQALVAVSLELSEAIRAAREGGTGLVDALEECRALVEGCTRDVRTLSYGLHPPMLDEMGLHAALEEFVKEMAKRSGLELVFECSSEMGRLGRETETALFRVAQEALLNVHRHSGSPDAKVVLRDAGGTIELEVSDSGRGIPEDRLQQLRGGIAVGVGVSGMQERLRQLGGELEIRSNGGGTVVLARLPCSRAEGSVAADRAEPTAVRWV